MRDNYNGIPIKDEYIPRHIDNSQNNRKTNKRKQKKNKNINIIWSIFLVFFVLITLFGVYKLFDWYKDNKNTNKIIDNINKTVEIIEREDDDNTELINEPEKESESD